MWIKKAFLLIMCGCIYHAMAGDITKVLQNGRNEYTDCSDSYLFHTTDDSSSLTQNFGSDEFLLTAS